MHEQFNQQSMPLYQETQQDEAADLLQNLLLTPNDSDDCYRRYIYFLPTGTSAHESIEQCEP